MSGRKTGFAALKAASLRRFTDLVPQLVPHTACKALDLATSLSALIECQLGVRQRNNHVAPHISCAPSPKGDRFGPRIIAMIHEAVEQPFRGAASRAHFSLEMTIDEAGFIELMTALVSDGTDLAELQRVAGEIGQAVETLNEQVGALVKQHFDAVLRRDLHVEANRGATLTPMGFWALASDLSGTQGRPIILERRRQALEAYGALASMLRDAAITPAIDRGEPLVKALRARLDLSEAELRRLHNMRPIGASIQEREDYAPAVTELKAHSVPLHEWPAADEWSESIWQNAAHTQLLRPDYVGNETDVRDALAALRQDLLEPVAAARAAHLGLVSQRVVANFLNGLDVPTSLWGGPARRAYLTGLREAIIGPRGIKSFREGVALWHRRAAMLAALRHEENAEQPGWPALCAPWSSADGAYRFVPLTSAADLVEEGTALGHCVGGYYGQCRSGNTQILSLRARDRHAATLELLLSGEPGQTLIISVGQFKTFGNTRPDEPSHVALRAFMDDLRSGAHPIARREIGAYRKRMARTGDYSWRGSPLPLDHARKAWPLYRPMLPRGTPDSFDQWCEVTGLAAIFDKILMAVARAGDGAHSIHSWE